MSIDRTTFFTYVRRAPFGGRLTTAQVQGCERLLAACAAERVTDRRQVAYVLASVFHETGGRMQPVRETFASSDAEAMANLEKAWREGRLGSVKTPYWRKGWFGRGDIQITHEVNYRKLGGAIGVDLVADPRRALDPEVSARIAVIGMANGLFTGKSLADFFPSGGVANPLAARAIVNGKDKAKLIAGYYTNILDALIAAEGPAARRPSDVSPAEAAPDDVPAARSGSAATVAVTTGASAATALVAAISNPWALLALVFILVAGGVGAWLLYTGRVTINRAKARA